jgi:hypothetical protein
MGQELVDAIVRDLGEPRGWVDIHTYPQSLAECVIDALWSERVRYGVIVDIIERYRAFRAAQGADGDTDSARDLLDTFSIGLDAWMDQIGNRQRAYSRTVAPFKAELVREGAQAGVDSGVTTTEALRRDQKRNTAGFADFKSRWLLLPSQHSGLTWERLLLVAGIDDVAPDGWIVEYLNRELGLGRPGGSGLDSTQALSVLNKAANELGSTSLKLRNAIWRFETKRDRQIGHGPKGTHATRAGARASQDDDA